MLIESGHNKNNTLTCDVNQSSSEAASYCLTNIFPLLIKIETASIFAVEFIRN